MQAYLCDTISRSLRLPASKLDVDQPVTNLGLDSLIDLEVRNRIQVDMGVRVPIAKLLHGPSIAELATYLSELFGAEHSHARPSLPPTRKAPVDPQAEVEKMSDEEVDVLLNKLMASKTSNV